MTELLRLDWLSSSELHTLRRHGREVGAALGIEGMDQIRVATALSEVGRELLAGRQTKVVFEALEEPPRLVVTMESDAALSEDGRDPSSGIAAARRLLDEVTLATTGQRTRVRLVKELPARHASPGEARGELAARWRDAPSTTALDELRAQNRELVGTLDELGKRQEDLERLNDELTETNRGVLAMYGQLQDELERTNRGVVALYAELDTKNDELARASESKSRFFRNVSHELRAPLNSIVGLTALLAAAGLEGEQRRQVAYIASSARSLLGLVNELLELARAEADQLLVDKSDADLTQLFATLQATLSPMAAARGLELRVHEPVVPVLRTDPVLLTRVLRNLVTNAVSFTERGRVVVSSALSPSGALEIAVSDTGIGISAEHRDLVFEEFVQLPGPLQRDRNGSGLGLAYVRLVAEALGGSVRLESEVGAGSVFTVTLPAPPAPGAAPERVHVLVADDDEGYRVALRGLLGSSATVSEAAGGEEAVRLARERSPDLLLLDIRMPDLDGWAVLERLRADRAGPPDRPVIVLMTSGEVDDELRQAAGATTVLSKAELTGDRLGELVLSALPSAARGEES